MKKIVKIQGSKWITSKSRFDNKNLKFISKNVLGKQIGKKIIKETRFNKGCAQIRKTRFYQNGGLFRSISELVDMKGYATTLDISRYMNVSAPSVTKMLKRLDENKYLEYEKYHGINLTKKGTQLADTIRQKHSILLEFFEILGIGKDIANQDAEGIEHHLNPKTIKQLRKFMTFLKSNPKFRNDFKEF